MSKSAPRAATQAAPQVKHFKSPEAPRRWLAQHHARAAELWVGFHKVGSGKASVTYLEALDEALCFGWIDGVRKSLGDSAYTIRFTPRKRGSYWSLVNIKRAKELEAQGRMTPAGLAAFAARDETKARRYSNEAGAARLTAEYERQFRANKRAWDYWEAQPPSYRKAAGWWVISAKKEETRLKRLGTLIEDSQNGRWVRPLTPPAKRK